MFDSMREHYESIASQAEINRERFAGEDLSMDDERLLYEEWEDFEEGIDWVDMELDPVNAAYEQALRELDPEQVDKDWMKYCGRL